MQLREEKARIVFRKFIDSIYIALGKICKADANNDRMLKKLALSIPEILGYRAADVTEILTVVPVRYVLFSRQ